MRRLKLKGELVDFASNDYLGLSRSEAMKERFQAKTVDRLGSSGSRLLTGNSKRAMELEERIAAFHGYEAGLLYGCGYLANMGLISGLASRGSTVYYDVHVHASTRDGIVLSRAKNFSFRHNDLNHLEERLKSSSGERFVCVESIYSTDGSMAPLDEIERLTELYGAKLLVDEAHAVGVFGPCGRGLAERAFAKVVTFSKALGAFGAAVLGSRELIDQLVNQSRALIYTTALPSYALAAIESSYDLFPSMGRERKHLFNLIEKMGKSPTPIQPAYTSRPKELENQLEELGFDARALLPPTVKKGKECVRITLHAFNTTTQLEALCKGL